MLTFTYPQIIWYVKWEKQGRIGWIYFKRLIHRVSKPRSIVYPWILDDFRAVSHHINESRRQVSQKWLKPWTVRLSTSQYETLVLLSLKPKLTDIEKGFMDGS